MPLSLGKMFNRNYNIRLPFLDGFYDIGIFYNTKSPFLLFSVDGDFCDSSTKTISKSVKINMFKNIEASLFCSSFLELHNYKSQSLDIMNQFKEIKNDSLCDINFIMNENLILTKHSVNNSIYFDQLILYGFALSAYTNEFIFLLSERQFINLKYKCKIVRTSGIQISTTSALEMIERNTKLVENEFLKPMEN